MQDILETEYVRVKQEVYRDYSRSYDDDRKCFVGGQDLAQRVDWALETLTEGSRLLDLGCGSGDLLSKALELCPAGPLPVGLDLTPEMLTLAQFRLNTSCVLAQANAAARLPLQDAKFDLITSLNLIQELPRKAIPGLLREIHRVLKPGGELRAVIPCMLGKNPSSLAFRRLALERGAMDFLIPGELEALLNHGNGLADRHFHLGPSSAAAAAASGETRFRLFAQIMDDLWGQGLNPHDVTQGVMFFSAHNPI